MARTTNMKPGRALQRAPRPVLARRGPAIWERIVRYLHEVRAELARVDWPSRKELIGSTLIVLVVLIALALYLGAWDYLFTVGVRELLDPSQRLK